MRLDNACGADCGDPWDVLGWVNLEQGQTQTRPNPTNNQWFYYYAEADDGSIWGGNFSAEVRQEPFEKCTCLGVSAGGTNPYHTVGMAELDLSQWEGSTSPDDRRPRADDHGVFGGDQCFGVASPVRVAFEPDGEEPVLSADGALAMPRPRLA